MDQDYVTDLPTLRVAKSTRLGGWFNLPVLSTTANTITVGPFKAFSDIALANAASGSNPLPISLVDFTAEVSNGDVLLKWQTMSEVNNDYFTVETSVDGINFEAIGVIPGAGTTSEFQSYSFVHRSPSHGTHYYRLRQTDLDGQSVVSDIVGVTIKSNEIIKNTYRVYPVPSSLESISVVISSSSYEVAHITLISVDGIVVSTRAIELQKGGNILKVSDLAQLSSGVYVIRIATISEVKDLQFIVK